MIHVLDDLVWLMQLHTSLLRAHNPYKILHDWCMP